MEVFGGDVNGVGGCGHGRQLIKWRGLKDIL
jgi:hypothetical protein